MVAGEATGLEVAVGLKRTGARCGRDQEDASPVSPATLTRKWERSLSNTWKNQRAYGSLFGKGIDTHKRYSKRVESVKIAEETIDCDIVVMAVGMRGNNHIG